MVYLTSDGERSLYHNISNSEVAAAKNIRPTKSVITCTSKNSNPLGLHSVNSTHYCSFAYSLSDNRVCSCNAIDWQLFRRLRGIHVFSVDLFAVSPR
ncbi:hypothetical protein Y032_0558g3413 [Ancylostoma ceylanicum]|uniref:Uncharacterized protein n=1 Tax=Ancylostoma ceylanicum TaxID=53326 RepID=A0A016WRT9_9BILA|nr:hypothetical protein Y032_0558g3413 [Ancylostoma ceylanicum]